MEKIGKYEVIEFLGRGGMGKVYKCRIPMIDEVVAVKLFAPVDELKDYLEDLKARFVREAKILWELNHPHIVSITDVDKHDATPFYVMEYLPGSLAHEIGTGEGTRKRKGAMPEDRVIKITRHILTALEFLHKKNIVHRDIKPSNILITKGDSVKLADFGIAKVVSKTKITKSGVYLGDSDYMAPEQTDAKSIDLRADLYSLSTVLYVMLANQHPYRTRFEKPSFLNKNLSFNWDDLIHKGTMPVPGDRFQSAGEMLAALETATKKSAEPKGRKPENEDEIYATPVETEVKEDADSVFIETEILEPEELLAIKAEKEEKKEKSIPVKKKRVSLPVLIVTIAVLVLLAGVTYGTLTFLNSKNIRVPFISDLLFEPQVEDAGNLMITPLGVTGKFVENAKTGQLFVITGRVKNDYSHNRRFIKITGALFTRDKAVATTATVFCGNSLSDDELSNLDLAAIKKRLMNRYGDKNSNLTIKPGRMIPFMIVFSNLPNNLDEWSAEVTESMQG